MTEPVITRRGGRTFIDGVCQPEEGHPGVSEAETYEPSGIAPVTSQTGRVTEDGGVDQTAQAGAPVPAKAAAKKSAARPAKAAAKKAAAAK